MANHNNNNNNIENEGNNNNNNHNNKDPFLLSYKTPSNNDNATITSSSLNDNFAKTFNKKDFTETNNKPIPNLDHRPPNFLASVHSSETIKSEVKYNFLNNYYPPTIYSSSENFSSTSYYNPSASTQQAFFSYNDSAAKVLSAESQSTLPYSNLSFSTEQPFQQTNNSGSQPPMPIDNNRIFSDSSNSLNNSYQPSSKLATNFVTNSSWNNNNNSISSFASSSQTALSSALLPSYTTTTSKLSPMENTAYAYQFPTAYPSQYRNSYLNNNSNAYTQNVDPYYSNSEFQVQQQQQPMTSTIQQSLDFKFVGSGQDGVVKSGNGFSTLEMMNYANQQKQQQQNQSAVVRSEDVAKKGKNISRENKNSSIGSTSLESDYKTGSDNGEDESDDDDDDDDDDDEDEDEDEEEDEDNESSSAGRSNGGKRKSSGKGHLSAPWMHSGKIFKIWIIEDKKILSVILL